MDPSPSPILIVDDDTDMQIFVAPVLSEGGVVPAPVGCKDALSLAQTLKPALIVLGAPMHCAGGPDLYHRLRTDPGLRRIPVILLSTIPRKSYLHYQRMQESRQGQSLPEPDDFLLKPPEAEELLRRVGRLTQPAPGLPAAPQTIRGGLRPAVLGRDPDRQGMTRTPHRRTGPHGCPVGPAAPRRMHGGSHRV